MTDLDDELRELFERRAGDVPPHAQVPASLRARSRRRIALNGLVAAVVVVALGGAAVGGLQLIRSSTRITPGGGGSAPASGATVEKCTSAELRVDARLGGAMGSVEGEIRVSNDSSATCTLRGYPGFLLHDSTGGSIVSGFGIQPTDPQWKADRLPTPEGWPVVTLRPGAVASVRFRWSNWCSTGAAAVPTWDMKIPSSGNDPVYGMDAMSPPPCNGPSFPSTIWVGPFEPAKGLPVS
jgi:Protein of unknown function (DUF4232)